MPFEALSPFLTVEGAKGADRDELLGKYCIGRVLRMEERWLARSYFVDKLAKQYQSGYHRSVVRTSDVTLPPEVVTVGGMLLEVRRHGHGFELSTIYEILLASNA